LGILLLHLLVLLLLLLPVIPRGGSLFSGLCPLPFQLPEPPGLLLGVILVERPPFRLRYLRR
jgi:hypothetical protein